MNDTSSLLGAIIVIYDLAGLLTDSIRVRPPSRFHSGILGFPMTDHSDEFVQDFHLFPFSPAQTNVLPAPVKSEHVKILSQGSL